MSDITVSRITVEIYQDPDSDDSGDVQEMNIEITDAGGGPYPVISTNRWAFDDSKGLVDLIEGLVKRFDFNQK